MKNTILNKDWQISSGNETEKTVIPHDVMISRKRCADSQTGADQGFFETASALYSLNFNSDGKKHHFLYFDGIMGNAEICLNGNLLSCLHYGYTPFICNCDDFIPEENNLLQVKVNNTAQPSSRWYTGLGIYREVKLLSADEDYFTPLKSSVATVKITDDEAYLTFSVSVHASSSKNAVISFDISQNGKKIKKFEKHVWLTCGENSFSFNTTVSGAGLWSPENPIMSYADLTLKTDVSEDNENIGFGIRTTECSPEKGFMINGKPVKLIGACIHHDNGIVGAASFRSAEERKIRILKEAGFNAVRTAHNPPSSLLLDVCDKLGMLVIDELFDAWRMPKRTYDYHLYFDSDFKKDTAATVMRDRNHPSVIMWSTGNEIEDKRGVSYGYRTSNEIIGLIKKLDSSRPVTHALCTFWESPADNDADIRTRDDTGDAFDYFTEKTAPIAECLDVCGYNYLLYRLEKDLRIFPERLIAMTESFPLDAVRVKKALDKHPRFIGEFVWTGLDYFGETGIGHTVDGEGGTSSLTSFPEHTANCGDINIIGNKTPQSYYRKAAINPGSVYIVTESPSQYGKKYSMSAWGFYRVSRSWNYTEEGAKTKVFLYSTADLCELRLNGELIGQKKPSDIGIAEFELNYRPGKLEATAFTNDKVSGTDILETTGKTEYIKIKPDLTGTTGKADLIYAEISLKDASGRTVPDDDMEITVSATGAKVIGIGNGDSKSVYDYTGSVCKTYRGCLLCALLPDNSDDIVKIKAFSANNCLSEVEIKLCDAGNL